MLTTRHPHEPTELKIPNILSSVEFRNWKAALLAEVKPMDMEYIKLCFCKATTPGNGGCIFLAKQYGGYSMPMKVEFSTSRHKGFGWDSYEITRSER